MDNFSNWQSIIVWLSDWHDRLISLICFKWASRFFFILYETDGNGSILQDFWILLFDWPAFSLDGQDQSWSQIEMNQMVMSVREVALDLVFYQFCMKNIYSILAPLAELQSHNPKQLTLIQNT